MKVSSGVGWKICNYLCDLVKLAEELVERVDQFTRRAVACQPGESHDVGVENAEEERNSTP